VDGDPSQDVKCASVIFLVDAKLVLLQPSMNQGGGLKYDMRIIANRVEYFDFMRDRAFPFGSPRQTPSQSPSADDLSIGLRTNRSLRDSLWYFDGDQVHCWMDAVELVQSASSDKAGELSPTVTISTDFYPLSIVLKRGIVLGIEPELIQRRDVSFAMFRFEIRVSNRSSRISNSTS
jgi:RAB6A-GEF complex partner protein 1